MQIRCPHCHHPVEVVDEKLLDDVTCPSCGSNISLVSESATEAYLPPSARRLGHFELLDRVGIGGYGTVWKARDTVLDRIVALKVPRRGQLDASEIEYFLRDARAAAQLRHPNIVSVHEVGRDGETVFIASDYIDGANLKEWLSARPMTVREAAEFVAQIADAVQHAHERGVVHRDLKPGNILIDQEGHPHVADFGLAKRETGEVTMTVDGQILGTPAYMSPEQARGKAHEADAVSDVYSLGVILFELLTGELPFRGEKRMLILQILNDEPPSPRKLNGRVPRDLETICLKAMAKEPERRYSTAAALAEDLERFLHGHPILARPSTRVERTWRWCRRNPTLAWLSGSIAVLLLTIAAGATITAAVLGLQKQQLSERTQRLQEAEQTATQNLWRAYHAQVKAARWSRRPGQRVDSLSAAASAGALLPKRDVKRDEIDELRNEAIACMPLLDLAEPNEWDYTGRYTPGSEFDVDFDPLLERAAIVDAKGTTHVVHIRDRSELLNIQLPKDAAAGGHPQFSRDGRYLALRIGPAGANRDFHVWELEGKKLVLKLEASAYMDAFDFHPNSKIVVTGSADGYLAVCELESGNVNRFKIDGETPFTIAFSPDGKRLAISTDRSVQIREVGTGRLLGRTTRVTRFGVAWSPDGNLLAANASTQTNFEVHVFELSVHPSSGDYSFRLRNTLRGHESFPTRLAFSHDGKILASTGWDGQTYLWDPYKGRALISIAGTFCRFGPGDKQLSVSSTGSVAVWDLARSFEYRRLECQNNFKHERVVAFSADDRWLVSTGADGVVRFWNALTGREVLRHDGFGGYAVAVSHDGKQLITSGPRGLHKWPIKTIEQRSEIEVEVGPPLRVSVDGQPACLAQSDDGRTLAFYDLLGQIVVIHEGAERSLHLSGVEPGHDGANVALSPNGKLVAHGTWDTSTVKVWDADSGELLRELPTGRGTHVAFSPDGQLFAAVSRQEFQLWEVDDWKMIKTHPEGRAPNPTGCVDFASNTRLLAATYPDRMIQLMDSHSGMRVAIFEAPDRELLTSLRFNADGTKLAATTERGIVHFWHLRQVRERLIAMNLDWDLPPFPPAKEASTKPLRLTIVRGNVSGQGNELVLLRSRAERYARQSKWENAAADYRRLINIDRNDHFNWVMLAPILLHLGDNEGYGRHCRLMLKVFGGSQGPYTLERVTKACSIAPIAAEDRQVLAKLAERATEIGKGSPDFHWICLARGLAEYRQGNHQESIDWLRQSMETGGTHLSTMARLTLAMAQFQLGDKAKALSELAEMQRIMDSRFPKPDSGRLGDNWHDALTCWALRAEAEKVVTELGGAAPHQTSGQTTP